MTLCIVWREGGNVKFASDSRLTFDNIGSSDLGIKIVRIPFNVFGPNDSPDSKPLIFSGDLGMAFAGSAIGALMVKEALAELLFSLQCIPTFHDYSMDGVSDFIFRAYEVISRDLCATILERGRTCIIFAGYCVTQKKLRVFRMETDDQNKRHKSEILGGGNAIEVIGTGREAALKIMPSEPNEHDIIDAIQSVIDDPDIPTVGGNIQYGSFAGSRFRPAGVAKMSDAGVHYWRGSLDLNGPDFDHAAGLLPNFPHLDLIT